MDKSEILVYDSGIGGLTVLNRLVKEFPSVNFSYLSDFANAPYGNKDKEQLFEIVYKKFKKLVVERFSAVVLACNTLSTNCAFELQSAFPKTLFIRIKPELERCRGRGLLLCTEKTAQSDFVVSVAKNNRKLMVAPMQRLVAEVEKNIFNLNNIDLKSMLLDSLENSLNIETSTPSGLEKRFSSKEFGSFDKIEYLFLGCTHFAFLKNTFQRIFKNSIIFEGVTNALSVVSEISTTFDHKTANFCKNGIISFIGEDSKRNDVVWRYLQKTSLLL